MITLLLSSCYQDIYKAYYVGDGGSMYFIFPIDYKSNEKSNKIEIDYTINEKKDSVRVNFTLISKQPPKIELIHYLIGNEQIELSDLERILFDKRRSWFSARYSSSISMSEMRTILGNPKSSIILNNNEVFSPSGKTISNLEDFNSDVMRNMNTP